MGIVAKSAHQSGRKRSAATPKTKKTAQKIFFSMLVLYRAKLADEPARGESGNRQFRKPAQ